MLLRRITEHVKSQNWTAVALDFVIVVVGVFMGIQLGNWNEARGDRQRETQILRDIATDLSADIDGYDVAIDSAVSRIVTLNYIFENSPNAALSDTLEDTESFELGLSWSRNVDEAVRAGSLKNHISAESQRMAAKDSLWSDAVVMRFAQPGDTAFDALVNSGELGILENKEIVRQLQEYRTITSAIEKSQDVTFRPSRDAAIAVGQKFGLPAFGTVNEEKFLDLVGGEPELAASLQTLSGWQAAHYLMLVAANQSAQALLQNIESELGDMPVQNNGGGE